jgi:hypothetical protein
VVKNSWFFYGKEFEILSCQSEDEVGAAEEQSTSW